MYRTSEDEGEGGVAWPPGLGMDLESVLPYLNRNIIGPLMVVCPG